MMPYYEFDIECKSSRRKSVTLSGGQKKKYGLHLNQFLDSKDVVLRLFISRFCSQL